MLFQSTITCPHCGLAKTETMPTNACQFFYACTGCGTMLKPTPGTCCVFCSYGSVPCPPIQAERAGKSGAASCCTELIETASLPASSSATKPDQALKSSMLNAGHDWDPVAD